MDNPDFSDIDEDSAIALTQDAEREAMFSDIDEGAAIECTQKAEEGLRPSRFTFKPNAGQAINLHSLFIAMVRSDNSSWKCPLS